MDFSDMYGLMNSPWGGGGATQPPLDLEYTDSPNTSLSSSSPSTSLLNDWRQNVSSASHVGAQSISSPITGSPQQTSTPLPARNRRSEDENGDRQSEEGGSEDRERPASPRMLHFVGGDTLLTAALGIGKTPATSVRVLSSTTEKLNEEKIRAYLDRCLKAPIPPINLPEGWRGVEVTPGRIVLIAPEHLENIARTLCTILQLAKSGHLIHTSPEIQLIIQNTFNNEASLAVVRELLKHVWPARTTVRTIRNNTQDASARKPKSVTFRDVALGVRDALGRLNTEQAVIEAFVDCLRVPEADEPLYVNLKQHELREAVRENQIYNAMLFFSDDDNEMRKNQIIKSPNEANGIFEILLIKYQKKLFEEFETLLVRFIDSSTGAFVENFAEEYNRFIEEDDAQSETSSVTEYEFALGEANYEAACRVHDELCQLVRKDVRFNERSFFGARNEDLCRQMEQFPAKSIEILDALFAYYQSRAFDNFETCLSAYVEEGSGRFVPDFGLSEEDGLLVIDERQLGDYRACLLLMDKLAPRFDDRKFGAIFDKSDKLIVRQIQKYPRAVRAFYLHLEILVDRFDNFPFGKKTAFQEIKTLVSRHVRRITNNSKFCFNEALLALDEEEIYNSRLSGGAAYSEESRKILEDNDLKLSDERVAQQMEKYPEATNKFFTMVDESGFSPKDVRAIEALCKVWVSSEGIFDEEMLKFEERRIADLTLYLKLDAEIDAPVDYDVDPALGTPYLLNVLAPHFTLERMRVFNSKDVEAQEQVARFPEAARLFFLAVCQYIGTDDELHLDDLLERWILPSGLFDEALIQSVQRKIIEDQVALPTNETEAKNSVKILTSLEPLIISKEKILLRALNEFLLKPKPEFDIPPDYRGLRTLDGQIRWLSPKRLRDLVRADQATQDSNAVNAPQELSVVSKGRQKRPLDLESSNVMTVLRRLYEVPPRLSLGFKPSSDYIGVILPDSMLWVSPERLRDLVRAVLRSGGMYREEDHHALSILPPDGPTSQLVEYHVTEEQPGFDPVLSFAPQYSGNGDEFVSSAAVSPSHTTSLNEELSRILPAFGFVPEPGVPRLGDPGPQGPKEPQAPRMHESDRARPLPGTGPKPVERSKKVAVPPPLGKVARQAAPVEAKSTWQSFKDRYIVVQDADPFILQVMKVAVRILALIAFPLTLALRLAFSFYDRCIAERVRPDGSFVPPVGARA